MHMTLTMSIGDAHLKVIYGHKVCIYLFIYYAHDFDNVNW